MHMGEIIFDNIVVIFLENERIKSGRYMFILIKRMFVIIICCYSIYSCPCRTDPLYTTRNATTPITGLTPLLGVDKSIDRAYLGHWTTHLFKTEEHI